MSQSTAFLGFSLRDTLTRLIPGLALIAPTAVGVSLTTPELLSTNTPSFLILAFVGYLTGEFVDQFRSGIFRVPQNFRYIIYKETDELEKMPAFYTHIIKLQKKLPSRLKFYEEPDGHERLTNNLDLDFRESMERELNVDFKENNPRQIYDLLLIYMHEDLTPRLRRMQSISIFSANLRLATIFGFAIYTFYYLGNRGSEIIWIVWFVSGIIAVIVFITWSVLDITHHQYIELLVKEYYMKQISSE
ncbi:hypothetical protein [Halorubrum coriense]|uniref:hypothetical protein n=1 Tax=Halorubrum coriense TaxID=64713 RepID=UPI0012693E23|nr:hypothetical protein [Halorubrum coriense]